MSMLHASEHVNESSIRFFPSWDISIRCFQGRGIEVKLTTKLLAVGAVAVLVVSGLAIALMASPNASAANDDSPVVTVDDQTVSNSTHNLTVNVLCKVNGTRTAVSGVNVTVCTMNITHDGNRTVIEIVEVPGLYWIQRCFF
jgi:hypothetical protein